MSDNTNIKELESEFQWFKDHLEQLQSEYPKGGHVVVKDQKPLGVWESRHEALSNGLKTFGNVPFLVRSIYDSGAYQVHFSTKSSF